MLIDLWKFNIPEWFICLISQWKYNCISIHYKDNSAIWQGVFILIAKSFGGNITPYVGPVFEENKSEPHVWLDCISGLPFYYTKKHVMVLSGKSIPLAFKLIRNVIWLYGIRVLNLNTGRESSLLWTRYLIVYHVFDVYSFRNLEIRFKPILISLIFHILYIKMQAAWGGKDSTNAYFLAGRQMNWFMVRHIFSFILYFLLFCFRISLTLA